MTTTSSLNTHLLPVGVHLKHLLMHKDSRGTFTEIFREEWQVGMHPVQWNIAKSEPGVLRGVHAHIRHQDYFILQEGHALIGLQDLRKNSPTEGIAAIVEMRGEKLMSLVIPNGVAHGFYFISPSTHIYAVSEYWNVKDELRCHWRDPHLKIPWPFTTALLSDHDARAGSFMEMAGQILEPVQNLSDPV